MRHRPGELFHADDVRLMVLQEVGQVAPGSPDRIMRDLRQKARINYRVVNRRESLYAVVGKEGELA